MLNRLYSWPPNPLTIFRALVKRETFINVSIASKFGIFGSQWEYSWPADRDRREWIPKCFMHQALLSFLASVLCVTLYATNDESSNGEAGGSAGCPGRKIFDGKVRKAGRINA
jgi:hypothetical protein